MSTSQPFDNNSGIGLSNMPANRADYLKDGHRLAFPLRGNCETPHSRLVVGRVSSDGQLDFRRDSFAGSPPVRIC